MNIVFFSEFDCLVETSNSCHELYKNNFQYFECEENVLIKVFPKNVNDSLSYYFSLTNTKNLSNCPVSIIKINHSTYAIKLLANSLNKETKNLSTLNHDYEFLYPCKIKSGEKLIYSKNIFANNAELYIKYGLVFCEIDTPNHKHIVVLDNSNNILVDENITSIEFYQNGFAIFKEFEDIQKQGVVKKFDVNNNMLSLTQEYAVYVQSNPKNLYNSNCNVLAFFESVRAKNTFLAKKYCTPMLAQNLNIKHLNYFGEFEEILIDPIQTNIIYLLNFTNHSSMCFKASIQDYLIDNFEKVE